MRREKLWFHDKEAASCFERRSAEENKPKKKIRRKGEGGEMEKKHILVPERKPQFSEQICRITINKLICFVFFSG